MLTDTVLKNLKPKDTPYKVTDRDGMYVTVSTAGILTHGYTVPSYSSAAAGGS
jgi:hypothetical protein